MPIAEIEQIVSDQAQRRAELKKEIADLDRERRSYVEAHQSSAGAAGLGAAMVDSLTEQAEKHGFEVE